jgi:hypothetical protein
VGSKAVEADHVVRALTGDEASNARSRDVDVRHLKERGPVARQPEEPLESEREVQVAACIEPALREGVESRQAALAERDPRRRVGSDDDIGIPGG